jgi:hypothetical protein
MHLLKVNPSEEQAKYILNLYLDFGLVAIDNKRLE